MPVPDHTSFKLFWPISAWTSSGLVVVLDGDSPGDHLLGTLLQNLKLPSKIEVKYEAPAPNGTLCSDWRREGYARQQWSNFYADLYSDADFLAVVDTDAAFIAPGKSFYDVLLGEYRRAVVRTRIEFEKYPLPLLHAHIACAGLTPSTTCRLSACHNCQTQ